MEDDFDLEGLSLAEARNYVAQFISSYNQTLAQLASAEDELASWKKRVELAADRGETDLAKDALRRAEETHARIAILKKEARDLDFKVLELKRRLGDRERRPEMTVNADALLERLESVVGTDHTTNDAIAETEAETALAELKRKMNIAPPDARPDDKSGADGEAPTKAEARPESESRADARDDDEPATDDAPQADGQ